MPKHSQFTQTSEFDHHKKFNVLSFQNPETQQLLKKYNRLITIRDAYAQIDLNESNLEIARKQKERVNALTELNNFSSATLDFLLDCQKKETLLRLLQEQVVNAEQNLNSTISIKGKKFSAKTDSVSALFLGAGLFISATICAVAFGGSIPFIIPFLVGLSFLLLAAAPMLCCLAEQYHRHRKAVKNATQEEPAVKEMLNHLEEKYKHLQTDASTMSQHSASSGNSLTFFPASSGFEVSAVVNPKHELSDAYSQTEEAIRPVF